MEGRDFISFGERLQTSSDDAERRTAISRAYYGLFHVVRQGLSRRGVPFHEHADDHKLIVTYLNQGTGRTKQIGLALARLRDMRNEADYVLTLLITSKKAKDACSLASSHAGAFESLSEPEIQGAIQRMRDLH